MGLLYNNDTVKIACKIVDEKMNKTNALYFKRIILFLALVLPLVFGCMSPRPPEAFYYFNGGIDELKVFNRVLTDTELDIN